MAKNLIDYNRETLRLRTSFLLFSGTLFLAAFLPSTKLGLSKLLQNTGAIHSHDFEKLVFVVFLICLFKALYYFFKLKSDTYLNLRLHFSSKNTRYLDSNDEEVEPRKNSPDNPHNYHVLTHLYDKSSHNFIEDVIPHIRASEPLGQEDGEILRKLDSAIGHLETFYKKEDANSKLIRNIFMWGAPYLFFGFSVFYSFSLITAGGLEFVKFITFQS